MLPSTCGRPGSLHVPITLLFLKTVPGIDVYTKRASEGLWASTKSLKILPSVVGGKSNSKWRPANRLWAMAGKSDTEPPRGAGERVCQTQIRVWLHLPLWTSLSPGGDHYTCACWIQVVFIFLPIHFSFFQNFFNKHLLECKQKSFKKNNYDVLLSFFETLPLLPSFENLRIWLGEKNERKTINVQHYSTDSTTEAPKAKFHQT